MPVGLFGYAVTSRKATMDIWNDPPEPATWDVGQNNPFAATDWQKLHNFRPSAQIAGACHFAPPPSPVSALFQLAVATFPLSVPANSSQHASSTGTNFGGVLRNASGHDRESSTETTLGTLSPTSEPFHSDNSCVSFDIDTHPASPDPITSTVSSVKKRGVPMSVGAGHVEVALNHLFARGKRQSNPISIETIDRIFHRLIRETASAWTTTPIPRHRIEAINQTETVDSADVSLSSTEVEADEPAALARALSEERRHFLWLTHVMADALTWKHEARRRGRYPSQDTLEFTSTVRAEIDAQAALEWSSAALLETPNQDATGENADESVEEEVDDEEGESEAIDAEDAEQEGDEAAPQNDRDCQIFCV